MKVIASDVRKHRSLAGGYPFNRDLPFSHGFQSPLHGSLVYSNDLPSFASTKEAVIMTSRYFRRAVLAAGVVSTVSRIARQVSSDKLATPPPHYPGHIPLTSAQNAFLAVGSGVMGVLDTSRGGTLPLIVSIGGSLS